MKNEPFTPPPDPTMRIVWESDRVELAALPLLLYLWGAVARDARVMGLALAIWALGFLVWSAWVVWRVYDRYPRDDVWRAVALIVYGGAAWALVVPAAIADGPWPWTLVFPAIFGPNVWALLAARRTPRTPASPRRRVALLCGAALLCLAWALIAGWLIWANVKYPMAASGVLGAAAVVVLGLNVVLAVQLARSAARGFTPPRPIQAEPLAEAPSVPAP